MRLKTTDADDEAGQPVPSDDRAAGGCSDFLSVSRLGDAVRIGVSGLGTLRLAPTLQGFVESELRSGVTSFVVDLENCQGMDSTFMGTFIGLSAEVRRNLGWFCLANVSPENHRLLKMLGVLHLISIHDGAIPRTGGEAAVIRPTSDPYARQKQIRAAHLLLMEADPANRERFGPFIEALEAEMSEMPVILPPRGKAGPEPGRTGRE